MPDHLPDHHEPESPSEPQRENTRAETLLAHGVPVLGAVKELMGDFMKEMRKNEKLKTSATLQETRMKVGLMRCIVSCLFTIVLFLLLISAYALYLGEVAVTEKIILGIVSFLGGVGIGRRTPK